MPRGRPPKWLPTTKAKPVANGPPPQPSQWEKDACAYADFCKVNSLSMGATALLKYAESQESSGLCRNAIANRMEALRCLRDTSFAEQVEGQRLSDRIRELRKRTANEGGPKRKPLVSISNLERWLVPVLEERDIRYQSVWWWLICTGARPEEMHHIQCKVSESSVDVRWDGRKGNSSTSAQYLSYPYDWAIPLPHHLQEYFSVAPAPMKVTIGTRKNCCSCINSWLRSFAKRHSFDCLGVTSTCPRVRMDNVIRTIYDEGGMTPIQFEALMGHTLETSQQSYRR